MIACTDCNGSISAEATACPHGGKPQPGNTNFRCEKCYVPNLPDAYSCRHCGTTLDPVRSRIKKEKQLQNADDKASFVGAIGAVIGVLTMLLISWTSGARR